MLVAGRSRRRVVALFAAVLGVGLVAGCTGDGAADASFPEERHEDSRAESHAVLEELLDDDGAHLGEVGEEQFIVSGGVDEDDDVTLPFLVAAAADGDDVTRYAARAGARLSYDGEFTTDVLQVRLDCPGSIDAQVWDGAREMLCAGLAAMGATEDDPWATMTAP